MIPNAAEPGGSHAGNRSLFDAPHPGQGAVRVVGAPSPLSAKIESKQAISQSRAISCGQPITGLPGADGSASEAAGVQGRRQPC